MTTARCAVIITNWNGKHFLEDCLGSLRVQTVSDFEVILVDNGSSDGSVEYVTREFPEVRVLELAENQGYCAANNLGIQSALGRGAGSVLLLNNDTRVAPDFVERMLDTLSRNPEAAAVCPKIYFMNQPDRLWYAGGDFSLWTSRSRHIGWKQHDHGQFDQERPLTAATGCALLARTSAIHEIGLLDEQFWAYVEDIEWTLRFLGKGYKVLYQPRAWVWHHDGGTTVARGSQFRRQYLTTRNLLLLCRRHVRWWQLPTFLLGFAIFHVGYYSGLRLARGDGRALRAIYSGIDDALQPIPSLPGRLFEARPSTPP